MCKTWRVGAAANVEDWVNMLVLHAAWSSNRGFVLWAEDSEKPVTSGSQSQRSARPHPFAASSEQLDAVLPGNATEAVIQLPSLPRSPLDSPEMVRVTPRATPRSEPTLRRWSTPAVVVERAAAVTLLRESEPIDGVRAGASVSYFAELAAFAEELVDTGRVLPSVRHLDMDSRDTDEATAAAVWRPTLQGRDVLTLQQFVTALPPVSRALVGESDPFGVITGALTSLVDAIVRTRLSERRLAPARRGRRPRSLPAAEAWLAALSTPDGRFGAGTTELEQLMGSLESWDRVGAGTSGPAHATFRVTEVDASPTVAEPVVAEYGQLVHDDSTAESDGEWRLEFLLQSTSDPSLLVSSDQVWDDDGTLRRWMEDPQEMLLSELGRASRLYPALVDSLRAQRPSGLTLDVEGVSHFLTAVAPALDEAGFGVLLPTWWNRHAGVRLTLKTTTPTDQRVDDGSGFGQEQLAEFEWQLSVGGELLTEAEIAALAEAKSPLVRFRGQWVRMDPEHVQKGLEFLTRERTGTKSVREILALAASGSGTDELPLELDDVQSDGWLGDLLRGAAPASLVHVAPPAGFVARLRPYQQRGLSWLSFLSKVGLGACLADDMGLGKTMQILALESSERSSAEATRPTLLICPTSLVGNWQRESARFAPTLRIYEHHGAGRLHGEELEEALTAVDVVVTSYGTATRDIDELVEFDWRRVVLDEAQAIKNSRSRSAQALRRLRSEHRVALTGTPVENRLSELWALMDFLNPGLLGPQASFRTAFAIPVERYQDAEAAERLRTIIRPYVLRRLKTDPAIITDLPEKIEMKQYCRLTVEQASLYKAVVDEMMRRIEHSDGMERRGIVLATMSKLKQVCNHPAQLLHDQPEAERGLSERSGKFARLEEILEEILSSGERVLLFTQFTRFAEMLVPHLAARFGTDVAYLHGGTTKKRRDEMVARFQSGTGPQIFLLSLKAGGTGLTLTAANHVVHLDRWWNPAVEDQATDRAFRIGQKKNVEVHKFISTGTLEERIDDLMEEKKSLAGLVVSDGEGWLTELSTNDLQSLFELSEETVDA